MEGGKHARALGFALKTLQGCAVTKGDSVTLYNEHGGETPLRMPLPALK